MPFFSCPCFSGKETCTVVRARMSQESQPSTANSNSEDQDDRFRVHPLSQLRLLVRTTMQDSHIANQHLSEKEFDGVLKS